MDEVDEVAIDGEFNMDIRFVNPNRYVITFPKCSDSVFVAKYEPLTMYWTINNSSGKFIHSNANLAHIFEHVYETEKLQWRVRQGLSR